jgi:hypothetical protein
LQQRGQQLIHRTRDAGEDAGHGRARARNRQAETDDVDEREVAEQARRQRRGEYYLPELPPVETLLCARLGLETDQAAALLKQLSAMFFTPAVATAVAS